MYQLKHDIRPETSTALPAVRPTIYPSLEAVAIAARRTLRNRGLLTRTTWTTLCAVDSDGDETPLDLGRCYGDLDAEFMQTGTVPAAAMPVASA